MSSKRVILLTRDRCLPSKSNQFCGNNASKGLNNNNNEQLNSINLNKNNKSENIKFEQSKSIPFSKKSQNNNGFFDYKNDTKNALNDWKKNDTPNFYESLKTQEMKKEYKWETKVKKDCNKSTLSLHIEAYENLNESKNVTSKISFDFLKQQNKKLMNPGIMQFKTSQKLLNFATTRSFLNGSRSISHTNVLFNGEYEWKDPKSDDEIVNITYITRDGTHKKIRGKVGDNAMYLAHRYDIEVEGACEASLACCTCHVYVEEEYFDKIPEPKEEEEDMLDLAPVLKPNSRLSCQIILKKDLEGMTLTLPRITRNFYVDGHVPEPH